MENRSEAVMVSEWRGILAGQANGREGQQADDNKE